jgi:hypothetical protein
LVCHSKMQMQSKRMKRSVLLMHRGYFEIKDD